MRFSGEFTDAQNRLLADLQDRDKKERLSGRRERLSLKAVAPPVARLLYLLIIAKKAKNIAEFGTSHGYSTIHLAAAADRTGGQVYTVDAMSEKTAFARSNLHDAGLLHRVTLSTCDGAEFASSLPNRIDFIFVDYGVPAFTPAFKVLRDRIADGCLIFVDGGPDGYWDEDGAKAFVRLLDEDPCFLVSILPMHKDQLIAVRIES